MNLVYNGLSHHESPVVQSTWTSIQKFLGSFSIWRTQNSLLPRTSVSFPELLRFRTVLTECATLYRQNQKQEPENPDPLFIASTS